MIDALIDEDHAIIHVTSGALDVTYEVRPSELFARRRGRYSVGSVYARTGHNGFICDLAGAVRTPNLNAPYIFGGLDFERVVARAMSKARHLERVWRGTHSSRRVAEQASR